MITIEQKTGSRTKVILSGRMQPKAPLADQRTQRLVKAWYPGTNNPSIQILGSDYGSVELEGVWDEAYIDDIQIAIDGAYFVGLDLPSIVAIFDSLRSDGIEVSFTWEGLKFDGIIKEFEANWHHSKRVEWRLTIERTSVDWGDFDEYIEDMPASPEDTLAKLKSRFEKAIQKWGSALEQASDIEARYIKKPLATLTAGIMEVSDLLNKTVDFVTESAKIAKSAIIALENVKVGLDDLVYDLKAIPYEYRSVANEAKVLAEPLSAELALEGSPSEVVENNVKAAQVKNALVADIIDMIAIINDVRYSFMTLVEPELLDVYVVKQEDTLESISNHYYGTPDYAYILQEYNKLDSTILRQGTVLLIPEEVG